MIFRTDYDAKKGLNMQRIDADIVVSVSDLKKSPSQIMSEANGKPVAILNHNRVMAYMLNPQVYEAMLERMDDLDLIDIIKARNAEVGVPVNIDDLSA
jgi:antitoxin StbD